MENPLVLVAVLALFLLIYFAKNLHQKFIAEQDHRNATLFLQFNENEDFIRLFTLMDDIAWGLKPAEELTSIPKVDKMRYASFLAGVVNTRINDTETLGHLFQWHLDYLFVNKKVRTAFWTGCFGDLSDEAGITAELSKPYWKIYVDFATYLAKKYKHEID